MYCHWIGNGIATPTEASVYFTPIYNTSVSSGFIYWGWQTNFVNSSGVNVGALHTGMQAVDFANNPKVINCGGYDDLAGLPGNVAEGGNQIDLPPQPTGPSTFNQANGIFDWEPGRTYMYRLRKTPGQVGVPTGKVGWRGELTDFTNNFAYQLRDVYFTNGETIGFVSMWTEIGAANPPDLKSRWSEPRFQNVLVPTVTAFYGTAPANTNVYADSTGFVQELGVTRQVVENATLTHPGPVVRSWSYAVNFNNVDTLTIAEPEKAVADDTLIAVFQTDQNKLMNPLTGWRLRSLPTASHNRGRLNFFDRKRGTGAANYTFTEVTTGGLAGGILCVFGADTISPFFIGPVGESSNPSDSWTAPASPRDTNYGKVLYVTGRSYDGTQSADFSVPANCQELIDTGVTNDDWVKFAVGQEVNASVISGTVGAKAAIGPNGGGGQAVHLVLYPVLQRAFPSVDTTVGTWAVAPLWSKVNEFPPDDSNFISGGEGALCKLKMNGLVTNPTTRAGFGIRIRTKLLDASSGSLFVRLLQGTSNTLIASWTLNVLAGNAWNEAFLPLTEAQANLITNYTDLFVEQTATVA